MIKSVRQLPFPVEFVAVLTLAFGYFSLISVISVLLTLFPAPVDPPVVPFDSVGAYATVCYEIVALGLIALGLWIRGWDFDRIDWRPSIGLSLAGVALFAFAWTAYPALWHLAAAVFPQLFSASDLFSAANAVSPTISIGAIVLLSLVNPLFEEVLVVGYIVESLRGRRSLWFAINVSTAVRLVYHLYQGPAGIIFIIPVGICFAWLYARFGRLWPLIIAHGLLDFVPLMLARGL